MTLPYSPSRAVYEGNGAATSFPFAFKVWSADQLNVGVTSPQGTTAPAQGWSASLGESGGTVTYLHEGAPLPAGWRLAIVRNMPFAQGIDLVSASRFDPQVIEDGLDQATAELQQLNEKIARAVILPSTSDLSPEEVVAGIYASRDAAAASAGIAAAQASAAAVSASAAAQTVANAAEEAVTAATLQADAAAESASAAKLAEANAYAASEGMAPRMSAAEEKNAQQDARLDKAEAKDSQQDARLCNAEDTLAGKADADLSNATGNAISNYFYARDEKPSGTGGGTNAAQAWMTRDLNTVAVNALGVTLSGNRITLQKGRYYIEASVPSFAIDYVRGAVYDCTHSQYKLYGTSECAGSGDAVVGRSRISGEITLTEQTQLELRMWAQMAYGGRGCGAATATPGVPEIYSEIRIWKM